MFWGVVVIFCAAFCSLIEARDHSDFLLHEEGSLPHCCLQASSKSDVLDYLPCDATEHRQRFIYTSQKEDGLTGTYSVKDHCLIAGSNNLQVGPCQPDDLNQIFGRTPEISYQYCSKTHPAVCVSRIDSHTMEAGPLQVTYTPVPAPSPESPVLDGAAALPPSPTALPSPSPLSSPSPLPSPSPDESPSPSPMFDLGAVQRLARGIEGRVKPAVEWGLDHWQYVCGVAVLMVVLRMLRVRQMSEEQMHLFRRPSGDQPRYESIG